MGRRVVDVGGGILRIEQRVRVRGRTVGTDASGPACVLAHIHLTRGAISYVGSLARMCAPARGLVLLPPYAIVQALLDRCDAATVAVAFRPPAHAALPRHPVLLEWDGTRSLTANDESFDLAELAREGIDISRAAVPDALPARGKAIIDAEYATPIAIGRVAERLGTSPAAFARAFRAAYGIPPVRYRHQVRIADALTRLAEGGTPIDVGQDVGFEDLSRFYKIFRRVACAAPGAFRPTQSRNAKT